MFDCDKLLQLWACEYAIKKPIVWRGYNLSGTTLGRTYYYPADYSIYLNCKLVRHDIIAKAVLWHEFCHCAVRNAEIIESHGNNFNKWLFKKPILAIIDKLSPNAGLLS